MKYPPVITSPSVTVIGMRELPEKVIAFDELADQHYPELVKEWQEPEEQQKPQKSQVGAPEIGAMLLCPCLFHPSDNVWRSQRADAPRC